MVQSDEACTWRIKREGHIFKERQREQVICPKCGKELARGSLVAHLQTQHSVDKGGLVQEGNEDVGGDKPS